MRKRTSKSERAPGVACSALLDCSVCGCQPVAQINLADGVSKAIECACGRRTSWSVLGQEVVQEWNQDFGLKEQSNAGDERRT